MSYITWEEYSSLYPDITEETEFNRMAGRAQVKLDTITHMRARRFEEAYSEENATDFEKQVHMQIKDTFCNLLNTIALQEASGMGSGIASVSNDGYAESYRITTAAEKEAQIISIVRSVLSGTGLAGAIAL